MKNPQELTEMPPLRVLYSECNSSSQNCYFRNNGDDGKVPKASEEPEQAGGSYIMVSSCGTGFSAAALGAGSW